MYTVCVKIALGLTGNEVFRGKKTFELDNFVRAVQKRMKHPKRPKRLKRHKRPRRPRRIGKQLKHLKQILVNWERECIFSLYRGLHFCQLINCHLSSISLL